MRVMKHQVNYTYTFPHLSSPNYTCFFGGKEEGGKQQLLLLHLWFIQDIHGQVTFRQSFWEDCRGNVIVMRLIVINTFKSYSNVFMNQIHGFSEPHDFPVCCQPHTCFCNHEQLLAAVFIRWSLLSKWRNFLHYIPWTTFNRILEGLVVIPRTFPPKVPRIFPNGNP